MKNAGAARLPSSRHRLVCPECGHNQRFIQVMLEEAHLVDGNFNYIRLIQGIVDHYICGACGCSFEVGEFASS